MTDRPDAIQTVRDTLKEAYEAPIGMFDRMTCLRASAALDRIEAVVKAARNAAKQSQNTQVWRTWHGDMQQVRSALALLDSEEERT